MNVACGDRLSVNELFYNLRLSLSKYISEVSDIEAIHGEEREGDIPHSHADISKAKKLLGWQQMIMG